MQFNINDLVVHPSHGIGQIASIESIQYLGEDPRPYYKVVIDNGVIWVPVDEEDNIRIRPITTPSELDHFRNLLRSRPTPLSDDRYQRRLAYTGRLKQPSFEILCEVVRDLTAYSWIKTLNENDSATLRKVTSNLVKEWAMSSGISIGDAELEVNSILHENQQAYSVKI